MGLPRGRFLAILAISVAAFVVVGGPVWRDPHGDHVARIALSYAVIVPLVGLAFARRRPFPLGLALAAMAVIALIKLVLTAALLGLVVLAGG